MDFSLNPNNPLPTNASCYNIVTLLYDELQSDKYRFPSVKCGMTTKNVSALSDYCYKVQTLALYLAKYVKDENRYSKPIPWIGIYIAVASMFCVIAMGADLLRAFRNKQFWFPSKYFTLNAASITVITVAMKLPVDLSSDMPGNLDQATKLGSMAFMCTMMANLMPSLASMDNKTLLANVIGMAILVITVVVNICIEISTSVIHYSDGYEGIIFGTYFKTLAYIYVAMLLWLLVIMISSAITIPSSKQILEFKYQATGKRTLDDQENLTSMVEKLRQCVRRYWVMAESGSPQFVMASNQYSSTSGLICVIILVIELQLVKNLKDAKDFGSDYKWSTLFIGITQLIGVEVGTVAPMFRLTSIMHFTILKKWNKNHFMVFKVEKYSIQKLCEWKEGHITYLSSGSRSKTVVHHLKILFLELCIGVQKVIVVSSKMTGLIPIVSSIFVTYLGYYSGYCYLRYYLGYLKAMLFTLPIVPKTDDADQDLSDYVLRLDDEMELSIVMLKCISNAVDNLIQNAEKEQNKDLLVFLDTSIGFKGVENFDSDQVKALTSVKLVNSWSLPVVTLTCIAISIPNIPKIEVDRLLKSVREGLPVTHLVEEVVNNTSEYGTIRRETMTLWHEVEEKCMWLENTIKKSAFKGKTSVEILEWFANKAEEIVLEINKTTNGELMVNTPKKVILANSMYRTAKTILFYNQTNAELSSEKELFVLLSSMIADILCACFTNIPQVIKIKCRENAIEKRESSVEAAAKLFGRTKEILKRLEVRELPSMDPDKMGFIDEWRLHLKRAIP